jgi:hypothetical protein
MSMVSDGDPGLPPSKLYDSSKIVVGENTPSLLLFLGPSSLGERLVAESRLSHKRESRADMSVNISGVVWKPLSVESDENLECVAESTDDGAYDEKLLWLSENLCFGDLGLAESNGDWIWLMGSADICIVFVSSVNGSEYPPASHGVLFRLGVFPSLVRFDDELPADGSGPVDEHTEKPPTVGGVGVWLMDSSAALLPAEEAFNSEVTSILSLSEFQLSSTEPKMITSTQQLLEANSMVS